MSRTQAIDDRAVGAAGAGRGGEKLTPRGVARRLSRANYGHFAGQQAVHGFDLDGVRIGWNMVNVRAGNGARPARKFASWMDGPYVFPHGLMADAQLIERIRHYRGV